MLGPAIETYKPGVKAYLLCGVAIGVWVDLVLDGYNQKAEVDWWFLALTATGLTLGSICWVLTLRISFHKRGVSFTSCVHSQEMLWDDVAKFYYEGTRLRVNFSPWAPTISSGWKAAAARRCLSGTPP